MASAAHMQALAEMFQPETIQAGPHHIVFLEPDVRTGHITYKYDTEDKEDRKHAKQHFKTLLKAGYAIFKKDPERASQGEQVDTFDATKPGIYYAAVATAGG